MADRLFFPGTPVLTNFALMDHMQPLASLTQGRGQWVATVRSECEAGSRKPGLSRMGEATAIFGKALVPGRAERADTFAYQTGMLKPGDDPPQGASG